MREDKETILRAMELLGELKDFLIERRYSQLLAEELSSGKSDMPSNIFALIKQTRETLVIIENHIDNISGQRKKNIYSIAHEMIEKIEEFMSKSKTISENEIDTITEVLRQTRSKLLRHGESNKDILIKLKGTLGRTLRSTMAISPIICGHTTSSDITKISEKVLEKFFDKSLNKPKKK